MCSFTVTARLLLLYLIAHPLPLLGRDHHRTTWPDIIWVVDHSQRSSDPDVVVAWREYSNVSGIFKTLH